MLAICFMSLGELNTNTSWPVCALQLVMSIKAISIQILPIIGAVWFPILTENLPFPKALKRPSAYPIGITAMRVPRSKIVFLPYPIESLAAISLVRIIVVLSLPAK